MPLPICTGDPITDALCQGATDVGSAVFTAGATSALDATSAWVASGASWFLGQVGGALGSSTRIDLSAPWFLERYRALEALLAVVALPVLLLAIIGALLRQDLGMLIRSVLVQLPLGMLLAGAAVELTTLALGATDQLCRAVAGPTGSVLRSLTGEVASALVGASAPGGTGTPAFVLLLAGTAVALAGLVLWLELVIRAASIYVAVAFLPLVLVTMVWPTLASWSRRLAETLAALVLSKLVIVVVLTMAVGAMGTRPGRDFATVVSGIALLVLAAFAPFTLLKLLPLAEASAAGHLEGLRQRGQRSVTQGLPRRAVDLALASAGAPVVLADAPLHPTPNGPPAGVRSTADPLGPSAGPGSAGSRGPLPTQPAPGAPSGDGSPSTGTSPSGPAEGSRTSGPPPTAPAPGSTGAGSGPGPVPTRPAPGSSSPSAPAPAPSGLEGSSPSPRPRWPRDDPPEGVDEVVERRRPAPRPATRPPTLEIGRDATGPVIRPVRPKGDTDG